MIRNVTLNKMTSIIDNIIIKMTTCHACEEEHPVGSLTDVDGDLFCDKCFECDGYDYHTAPDYKNKVEMLEYDDKGVMCRYTEEDGWVPIEDHCVDCGHRCDACDCETNDAWVYPSEEEHHCDENHCEKCCRGRFCNCDGLDCGYCKMMKAFPESRNKSAEWWNALFNF